MLSGASQPLLAFSFQNKLVTKKEKEKKKNSVNWHRHRSYNNIQEPKITITNLHLDNIICLKAAPNRPSSAKLLKHCVIHLVKSSQTKTLSLPTIFGISTLPFHWYFIQFSWKRKMNEKVLIYCKSQIFIEMKSRPQTDFKINKCNVVYIKYGICLHSNSSFSDIKMFTIRVNTYIWVKRRDFGKEFYRLCTFEYFICLRVQIDAWLHYIDEYIKDLHSKTNCIQPGFKI